MLPITDSDQSYFICRPTMHIQKTTFKKYIRKTEYVKYLGIYVDNKLSWKVQIDKLCSKISKVCGMICKLRYFVPLSTLKIVYYSMFHSH